MDQENYSVIKKIIEQALIQLTIVENSQRAASETVILDQSCTGRLTRIDALQQQAMAKANRQRTILRKKQLKMALDEIRNSSYGLCLECEEAIALARLKVNPIAKWCISCAQEKEK